MASERVGTRGRRPLGCWRGGVRRYSLEEPRGTRARHHGRLVATRIGRRGWMPWKVCPPTPAAKHAASRGPVETRCEASCDSVEYEALRKDPVEALIWDDSSSRVACVGVWNAASAGEDALSCASGSVRRPRHGYRGGNAAVVAGPTPLSGANDRRGSRRLCNRSERSCCSRARCACERGALTESARVWQASGAVAMASGRALVVGSVGRGGIRRWGWRGRIGGSPRTSDSPGPTAGCLRGSATRTWRAGRGCQRRGAP